MPNYIEMRLQSDLRKLIKIYVKAFPYTCAVRSGGPVDFMADLNTYVAIIDDRKEYIISAACSGIQKYCNLFDISPRNGVEEFKSIYFLGRAIEAQLLAVKEVHVAQVHMWSMIGLMDEKLLSLKVSKPDLTRAMLRLIDLREFDSEMGNTGCYFTYKCSSTALQHQTGV